MVRTRLSFLIALMGVQSLVAYAAEQAGMAPPVRSDVVKPARGGGAESLSLRNFASLIARSDEQVLVQRLERDIAGENVKGSKSIFEPSFFLEAEHDSSMVQNSVSEQLQRSGQNIYYNKDNVYKSGVDFKLSTGADVEVFYNTSRLSNSLQDPTKNIYGTGLPEYRSSLGAKITQPLLRNRGKDATTANIRVAERDEEIAAETVRQTLAQRVMDGIVAYLNLQRAQNRVLLRGQAKGISETIVLELRKQEAAGLKNASEVLDAESAASLRRSQWAQAQQDLEEQQGTFQTFISARERSKGGTLGVKRYEAADAVVLLDQVQPPAPASAPPGAGGESVGDGEFIVPAALRESLGRRPEIRVGKARLERESIRLSHAENQALPELNLTIRYGIDDLRAGQYRDPSRYLFSGESYPYNSWMVGVQFRYFLQGDLKRTSEKASAQIRKQQVALAQASLEQRVVNELESSRAVMDKTMLQVKRQQEIVQSQRQLIKIEQDMLKEGKKSSLDVMKRQLDLLLAEENLSDSIVIANRASFLASQANGLLLKRLELE